MMVFDSKHTPAIEAIYEQFCARNYPECRSLMSALSDQLGRRRGALNLLGPAVFDPSEPYLQLGLIEAISEVRLGHVHEAMTIYMMSGSMGGSFASWVHSIHGLVTRNVQLASILEEPLTPSRRAQAYYYEAEGLLTDRDFEAATTMFARAAEGDGSCPEKRFASARLDWLRKHPPHPWT
jgi:hypothetical protein